MRARGHDAWSCDLLPAEDGSEFHLQCDVLTVLKRGWNALFGFPPCTYLTRSGWHWVNKPDCAVHPLKGAPRRRAAAEAATFFLMLLNAPIDKVCIENPRPISHGNLPPPTQTIQPWQFGHGETKTTCLWLRGLPPLQPTHRRDDLFALPEPNGREARIHKMRPSQDRSKLRSITYEGIARAMADQWG